MQASEFLQKKYDAAVIVAANGNQAESTLPDSIRQPLNVIIDNSESSKAVMTVVFTSAVYKCLHPQQDIRRHQSSIATPQNLTIDSIVELLKKHFCGKYHSAGASRLPVLALYAIYEVITKQISRYADKQLLPIESHTSADARSGRHGDIDVVNEDGTAFDNLQYLVEVGGDGFDAEGSH